MQIPPEFRREWSEAAESPDFTSLLLCVSRHSAPSAAVKMQALACPNVRVANPNASVSEPNFSENFVRCDNGRLIGCLGILTNLWFHHQKPTTFLLKTATFILL